VLKIESKVAAVTIAALSMILFAPDAQACGKKPWDAGFFVSSPSAPLQEPQPQQQLFGESENESREKQNGKNPSQIVGMWTVNFYVGDTTTMWDFGIEQFYADGTEMTNDVAGAPSVGYLLGVWEPSERQTVALKHIGLASMRAASILGYSAAKTLVVHCRGWRYFGQDRSGLHALART